MSFSSSVSSSSLPLVHACQQHCDLHHAPTAALAAIVPHSHNHASQLRSYLHSLPDLSVQDDRFLHALTTMNASHCKEPEPRAFEADAGLAAATATWIAASRWYEPWLFDPAHPFVKSVTHAMGPVHWIDLDSVSSLSGATAPTTCLWLLRPHLYTAQSLHDVQQRVVLIERIFPAATIRICPFVTRANPVHEAHRLAGWQRPWLLDEPSAQSAAGALFREWVAGASGASSTSGL
jgi:hypothetical protein